MQLELHTLRQTASILSWPVEMTKALEQALEYINGDQTLVDTVNTFHRKLFRNKLTGSEKAEVLKQLLAAEQQMGDHAGMLAAIVFAEEIPHYLQAGEEQGISRHVLLDTLSDFAIWMHNHKERHGKWGLSELVWLHQHFIFQLFRFGRLQFKTMAFERKYRVLRHRETGEILAFTVDERLIEDGGELAGHPFDRNGNVSEESVRVPLAEWETVLSEGDQVLDVHIPQGAKLTYEDCRASYRQAVNFFGQRCPEIRFAAFVCSSWLLSPQFRAFLPPESNIMQFQNDYHLFPKRGDDRQLFDRVFGSKPVDLETAPRDTSLQRAILDHYAAGGTTTQGDGFILIST